MNSIIQTIKTGFAIFSMFFGAGNILFPLAVGYFAGDQNAFAISGLLITAVGVPFAGLLGITLYNGDTRAFFGRLGQWPGFIMMAIILALLGPLGSTPRCVALAYATLKMSLPELSIWFFSAFACALVFLCAFKRRRIIDLLGYVLTPILLGSLGLIIVMGLINAPPAHEVTHGGLEMFIAGLKEGYNTMDLLAAFFFSSVVIAGLKRDAPEGERHGRAIAAKAVKAGLLGVGLLALVYIGFSTIAAHYATTLGALANEQLLGAIALQALGPQAGFAAAIAVSLACLTTAIALSSIFADFLRREICRDVISYPIALAITLGITFFVATLELSGIMAFLAPVLEVCYPVLIALTAYNIVVGLRNPMVVGSR